MFVFLGFNKWRYIFVLLNAVGMAIIYGLNFNLSVGIVAMLNHTALSQHGQQEKKEMNDVCGFTETSKNDENSQQSNYSDDSLISTSSTEKVYYFLLQFNVYILSKFKYHFVYILELN